MYDLFKQDCIKCKQVRVYVSGVHLCNSLMFGISLAEHPRDFFK